MPEQERNRHMINPQLQHPCGKRMPDRGKCVLDSEPLLEPAEAVIEVLRVPWAAVEIAEDRPFGIL